MDSPEMNIDKIIETLTDPSTDPDVFTDLVDRVKTLKSM